ncbi:M23 family metallopeptidase [Actinotalea sp. C106]|uniref:M23 family metallopeptidase n=1 Tax=Actinotalea sp. C106 TaxID=2908644 RepID=UPI0020280396|nr:M23 family metallopeptidase [Actinotalea sp. C106]
MSSSKALPVVAGLVPLSVIGGVLGMLLLGSQEAEASCTPTGASLQADPASVPAGVVAGYSGEQLANAAVILRAGADLEAGARDQAIAVMTAMGESGLRVIDHGDAAGPDSRGLFQQRDNGAWGSYADRMDPYTSATSFYRAMLAIPEREGLAPTIVAHRTQRNADPFHYERYWDAALEVVEAVTGTTTGLTTGTGGTSCTGIASVPGAVNPAGWSAPAAGPVTSGFGMRLHPVHKEWRLHAGTDFNGGGCNGPIWSVNDGVVTIAGPAGGYGNVIEVDHGGGLRTRYAHMYNNGVLVDVGDQVTGGQQIGLVGSSGVSTGCHLHFETYLNGELVDPMAYLASVGVSL